MSTSKDSQGQLNRVGQRIAAAAAKPDYKWGFTVLQGKQVNAFAPPGGKVAIWGGILPIAQVDNGIAVIMGHEIAHTLACHGAERMKKFFNKHGSPRPKKTRSSVDHRGRRRQRALKRKYGGRKSQAKRTNEKLYNQRRYATVVRLTPPTYLFKVRRETRTPPCTPCLMIRKEMLE